MAGVGNTTENSLVNHLLRNTAFTQPAALYLALYTAATDYDVPTVTEATGGSYARKSMTFAAASGGAAASSNAQVWTCGTDVAAGSYVGWGVYDAITSGSYLFGAVITSGTKTLASGDTLTFASGAVNVSLD